MTRAHGRAISQYPPRGNVKLWYSCLRKLPYSKKDAEQEAISRNRGITKAPYYKAYRCDHCLQYHVGHEKVSNA